jgi:hypothetical protein
MVLASSVGVVGAKTADQESFDLGGEFQAGGEGSCQRTSSGTGCSCWWRTSSGTGCGCWRRKISGRVREKKEMFSFSVINLIFNYYSDI